MGEKNEPHDGGKEEWETVELSREIVQADVLMDRATYYPHNKTVRGQAEVSREQLDVMYYNARAAYLLLKFDHPDKTVTENELDLVGELIESFAPVKNRLVLGKEDTDHTDEEDTDLPDDIEELFE